MKKHNKWRHSWHWSWKWSAILLLCSIAGLQFWYCLPDKIFDKPVSSLLISREGELLGAHIAKDEQWRFPPSTSVPNKFKQAILMFEDKRFYQHIGVDPLAIARALRLNIQQSRIASGGSTITMQTIRLSRSNPKRTILEKITEMFLALRLEIRYSKEEVLSLYTSHAPFGGNVVGLEAASWRYFSRKPEQLSWAESATLAVLPNSPALIHPGRNRTKLKAKRDRLLKQLREAKHIDQLSYQLAITEPLPQKPLALPHLAPHLLNTLVAKNKGVKQRFHSTLNKPLQQKIQQLSITYAKHLQLADIHNLSIVVIDNKKFETLAYIGNSPLQQTEEHGQAIDLNQRSRSTGSTLKPFLFASMIQQGEILPDTLVPDVPVHYSGFMPKNYDRKYRGAVAAKYALTHSLNIPSVNMLSQHGVARFQAFLQNMGMTTLHRPAKKYGLALILGGAEGSLWELAQLYANLAWLAQQDNRGSLFYRKAILRKDESTKTQKAVEISPASAWLTLKTLLDVTRPGNAGYWKKFTSSRKIAWKTGTSFGHRDAWALGVTPQYTVGVWVGNASGEGRSELTGSNSAAPILFDTFGKLALENEWFSQKQHQFKKISICQDDGFLTNGNCQIKQADVPNDVNFDQITPYHQRIHLDPTGKWRVHETCESVSRMQHKDWFVLPPDQAYYYQQHHADYKPLPPYRNDCLDKLTSHAGEFSLVYPKAGTQIYIPKELDGSRSKTVFRAIHQNPESLLYWHLDKAFIGTTQVFHQKAIDTKAGKHVLTLVDEFGNHKKQPFTVLEK